MNEQEEVKAITETAAVTATEVSRLQTRTILRVIFIVLAVAGVLWVLYSLEGVLLLVVLAIFFAYLIAPLVEFMHRPFNVRGREHLMPRALAIALVYLMLFGLLVLVTWFFIPKLTKQIKDFVAQSPSYLESAKNRSQGLKKLYDDYQIPESVRNRINESAANLAQTAGKYTTENLWNIIYEALSFIPWLILIPILAFFLLKDADSFRRSALSMLPSGRWRWRGDEFFQDVNSTLAAYIRAQLIACLLIGTICTIAFYFIGVPYFFLLGVMAGMLEFIPLVGPLAVAIIAALITSFSSFSQTVVGTLPFLGPIKLAQGGSFSRVVVVLIFLFVLRIIHDYVIYPRIIGQGIHLHPLAVILAILSGAEIAGAAGIFLAIPVVAIATVTYRHWLEHKGSEGLVQEFLKPELQPSTVPAVSDEAPVSRRKPHPTDQTTPEQMARARPDLTTGELKLKGHE